MSNAITKYESSYGEVALSKDVVLKYLARGNTSLNEQEITLFIELCKYQKLNPFVGEAYPIKFGGDFQMVIGYDTYKRRGEEHPEYRGRKSGIVVLRKDTVTKREGACVYPGEILIGGWCTVYRLRGEYTDESFVEVALSEYQKTNKDGNPMANWGSKPATMIRKVAVSQAMRDAFPTQYTGLYSEYEMPNGQETKKPGEPDEQGFTDGAEPITQEDRQALFDLAHKVFGKKRGNEVLLEIINGIGLQSTMNMTKSQHRQVQQLLEERAEYVQPFPEDQPDDEYQDAVIDGETGEVMEEHA